ncbi:carboxymuconolactone decarboxylase family protein [Flavobacterium aquiphilum]|uniref:carboxymuconolactone decarboxylase family protein n=1 Tax=Flavobacterium aquiphilum TaxID=3003261 RepID=UPI0024800A05|nr:carboxymuconolactone decarboxylase family protein [Flavobacterium aquiphilum]
MQTQRIDIAKVTPGAYQSLIQLDQYVSETSLPKSLYHLIKVRASLINGCALCIQSHSNDALNGGETNKRLLALNAWKDSPYFSEEEKVVLALTDEATLISENGVSDEIFNDAIQVLGEEKVSHSIMAIACINAWNRIGRATLLIPE